MTKYFEYFYDDNKDTGQPTKLVKIFNTFNQVKEIMARKLADRIFRMAYRRQHGIEMGVDRLGIPESVYLKNCLKVTGAWYISVIALVDEQYPARWVLDNILGWIPEEGNKIVNNAYRRAVSINECADIIINKARSDANKITDAAQETANGIIADANKEAKKMMEDLRTKGNEILDGAKGQIVQIIDDTICLLGDRDIS